MTIDEKYRVTEVIGDGGFGVVYRGVHQGFGEPIAVKCLKVPPMLGEKERRELLAVLQDEGRLLHRLSRATPGIVQALDVGAFTTPSGAWLPYLVLEWLEGMTLGDLMRARQESGEGGMPAVEALALLEPAARALAVAHAQKVAHRDVKPANLFVTQSLGARTLKVLDFGIAKVFTEHATLTAALAATAQSPSAFTPRYGAPEQFNRQRGATGPWTDVFALALIFVELVTGRRALDGDDPTQLYIASADPSSRPTLRGRGLAASDPVERVLSKALHVEPGNRYPDAGAFWTDLELAVRAASPTETVPGIGLMPAAAPDSSRGALATAEYAVAKNLAVDLDPPDTLLDGPRGAQADGFGPTIPADSLPPVGTSPKAPSGSPHARSAIDTMEETPVPARAVVPAAPLDRPTRAPTPMPEHPIAPGKRSGAGWPWVLLLLALGGGGVAYWVSTGAPVAPKPAPSAAPVTKPSARAAPPSSAAPAPSALAAPSASSSAPPAPPPPPEGMLLVPAGKLRMGARDVEISRPFFLDRSEVVVRDYLACVTERKCSPGDHVALTPEGEGVVSEDAEAFARVWSSRCNEPRKALDHPMNCVDFGNAEGYCRHRGKRLPTEAEWELAARGPAGRPFPWGDEAPTCARACYDRNSGCRAAGTEVATCAAGSIAGDRTPEGVWDLAGGVSEWVSDGFVDPPAGGVDPRGDPGAALRVLRGGSFVGGEEELAATYRTGAAPVTAHVTVGFRCAMDALPTKP